MATFILTVHPIDAAGAQSKSHRVGRRELATMLRSACPDVEWKASYQSDGPYLFIDIVEAADKTAIEAAADIVRAHVGGSVDVWELTQRPPFDYQRARYTRSATEPESASTDPVTEAHMESFPASDPPSWTP